MLFPLVRTLPRPQQSWLSPVSAEHDGHQIAKTRWTFKIKIFLAAHESVADVY
jgi:hypothetical protein